MRPRQRVVGAFVSYTGLLCDRTLLGEIVDVYYDRAEDKTRVRVRHFNGEPWPIEPPIYLVEAI